jgi:heme exporter protein D
VLAPGSPRWRAVAFVASLLAVVGLNIGYTSVVQHQAKARAAAEQRAREAALAEQQRVTRLVWCTVAEPVIAQAKKHPPATDVERRRLYLAEQLWTAYRC